MTQEEIETLAQQLVKDDDFIDKLVSVCSKQFRENTKAAKDKVASKVKGKLEEFFAQHRKKREQEIRDELDTWFFGHMKRQIENSKAGLIDKLGKQVERWLGTELDASFKKATKYVIENLIREKFADIRMSFTVGDLFGDRYNEY